MSSPFVRFFACVWAFFVLVGCSAISSPSAHALGIGAREGGLYDDKHATQCVGDLLYKSDLDHEARTHIAHGDLDGSDKTWSLGEEQGNHLWWDVELKMAKTCGVSPWYTADWLTDRALEGGLTNDPKAARCVGALIRDSELSDRLVFHLTHGSFDPRAEAWVLHPAEIDTFHREVETMMLTRCGVHPWPVAKPWNGAHAR